MADFYVRWGNDVQPYVLQLASEHIETLRAYCNDAACAIMESRTGKRAVIALTARVKRSMLKGKAFHRFDMFGFAFELRESVKGAPARKQEFILNFTAMPDFAPEDMPPRLRRISGKPLSARPASRRKPRSARTAPAKGTGTRAKKRSVERAAYRFAALGLWIQAWVASLATTSATKLYKMYRTYQRLSAGAAVLWRRRPRLAFRYVGQKFLTNAAQGEAVAQTRARLEPRLIGESLRLLLFTFVSPEPSIDWNAYPFGRLADQGEPIAA